MNKIFTKIASFVLGLGLAVGVGVSVSYNKVSEVRAAEEVQATITPTSLSLGSSYGSNTSSGNYYWTGLMKGNSSIQGNSSKSSILYNHAEFSYAITKIELEIGYAAGTNSTASLFFGTTEQPNTNEVKIGKGTSYTLTTKGTKHTISCSSENCYYFALKFTSGASYYASINVYGNASTPVTSLSVSGDDITDNSMSILSNDTNSHTVNVAINSDATDKKVNVAHSGGTNGLFTLGGLTSGSITCNASGNGSFTITGTGATSGSETFTIKSNSTPTKSFDLEVTALNGETTYHELSFDTDGGSVDNFSQLIEDGQSYTFVSPGTKSHYSFQHWKDDNSSSTYSVGGSITPTGDMSFTAIWLADQKYTVTFDLNGGTGPVPTIDNKFEGEKFNLPDDTDISKEGLVLTGWNDGVRGYELKSEYIMPANNVTFTAVWEKIDVYELVINVSDLKSNDVIVFVSSDNANPVNYYASGALPTSSDKYIHCSNSISIKDDKFYADDSVVGLTLQGANASFRLNNGDNYINTTAAKAMSCGTEAASATSWNFSIDATSHLATVSASNGTTDCGKILYNVGSPRFLNYTSSTSNTMKLPYIYKLKTSSPVENIPVENVEFVEEEETIKTGRNIQLHYSITPSNATNQNVTFSSDPQGVVDISLTGLVTGLNEGTTTVTIETEDGSFTDTCLIHVEPITYVEYTLVTDVKQLDYGDQIVIYGSGNNKHSIMKYYDSAVSKNNLRGLPVNEPTENKLTIADDETQEFTLGRSGTSWTIYSEEGYLYNASSSSDRILKQGNVSEKHLWNISLGDESVANIVSANVAEDIKDINLKYNGSGDSDLFNVYSSGQSPVQIFKKARTDNVKSWAINSMKIDSYNENLGYCTNSDYYRAAKTELFKLDEAERTEFLATIDDAWLIYSLNHDDYQKLTTKEKAAARYYEWAIFNGDENGYSNNSLEFSGRNVPSILNTIGDNSGSTVTIIVVSVLAVTAIGGYFFIRKRKELN